MSYRQSREDAEEYCPWCLKRSCRGECGLSPIGDPSSLMEIPEKFKCQRGSCNLPAMDGEDFCRKHQQQRDNRPRWR